MAGLRLVLLKNRTAPRDPYHDIFCDVHKPEFIPLLNHAPVDISQTVDYLTANEFLHGRTQFIITSQRAVEVLHECLDLISASDPATADIIRSKTGYTVGPATEQVLRENGFQDVRGGESCGNGSKLADLILEQVSSSQPPIVFFTGTIRKDIIPQKLKAAGVSVEELVVYKTEPKDLIIENFLHCCRDEVDWVVFFSPQGTEEIVGHMSQKWPHRARVASIGPTTEEYLLSKGIEPHVVAPSPTAQALYRSITRWEEENNY